MCAVFWATWLLCTGVPARCVSLRVRCPGPLGSCSAVCLRSALCRVRGVLGHLAVVHRSARPVCSVVASAVSWATWLLFTCVPARCVVLLRVRCPRPLGSCSPVCTLGMLCCVYGVLSHFALVQRFLRSACCVVACAVSSATWLLFTGVPARCVVLLVRCPWLLGSCSPVCTLGVLCFVFRSPGPPGSRSPVCSLNVLCCLCGDLGHLASVHRYVCSVRCAACAVSWAICSCSPVCTLVVLCCL